jgi:DNA-binding Lrp family transcriptional regulator
VDARDVQLLEVLAREPRAPAERAGAALGLSGSAVKARLARMRGEGALQGFVATPRAALLGMRVGLLVFEGVHDAPERDDELLRGLPEVPGVRFADVGPDAVHLRLLFTDEADWERIERATISLVGKPPSHRAQEPAQPEAALAPADVRLADALLGDARRSLVEVVDASGLSAKTARKRLDAMMARGDLRLDPVVSPAEASGVALCGVAIQRGDGSLGQALVAGATPREALARAAALRAQPGVERVFPLVAARRAAEGWLRDALQSRARPVPAVPERQPAAPPTVRR